jgi:hypothetical protein
MDMGIGPATGLSFSYFYTEIKDENHAISQLGLSNKLISD